jgi:transposase
MANREFKPPKRWSAGKKREVVLRLLRGEPLDEVSREIGVEGYRIEAWRDQALQGMADSLKEQVNHPLSAELDRAKKRIGELSMENELLYERCRRQSPLAKGRLKR